MRMAHTCLHSVASVAALLLDAHRRAAHPGSVALYLVRLTELAGLALAVAVHDVAGGPDPAVLRDRAERAGVARPVMAAAASVETLARVLEGLALVGEADRRLLVWAVREVHRGGGVPVVMVLDGTAIATSLSELTARNNDAEPFAWSLPSFGEA